jgi:hypothetical protein
MFTLIHLFDKIKLSEWLYFFCKMEVNNQKMCLNIIHKFTLS